MLLTRPLRFGVMCAGTGLNAWQARCLERLRDLPLPPTLALVIRDARPARPRRTGLLSRLRRIGRRHLAYGVLARSFLRLRSEEPADAAPYFRGVPVLDCQPVLEGRSIERFRPEDLDTIRSHALDFILRFGFNIIRGDILTAARYGVWSFHHGDEREIRGTPPAFWEIYLGKSVTGAILQRLTERLDAGVVLRRGHFGTIFHSYSKMVDRLYFGGVAWPAQVCVDLAHGRDALLNAAPSATAAPIFRRPTNLQTLVFAGKLLRSNVRVRLAESLWAPKWSIGIVQAPIERFLDAPPPRPTMRIDATERLRYFADPFVMRAGGEPIIVCEEFDHRRQKGTLAAFRISAQGAFPLGRVLAAPHHLSYPYTFEWEGEVYCVPECAESGEVTLYRYRPHPPGWERSAVLLRHVPASDPTVFPWQGRWWLAFSHKGHAPNGNLCLYHAPRPFGPWIAHEQNPVKVDIRSSRPAGTPFIHGGALYRPAQDCSRVYGGAVVLNRVEILTPDDFAEMEVVRLGTDGDPFFSGGRHTLSAAGPWTVMDGHRYVFTPGLAFRRGTRRLIQPFARGAAVASARRPAAGLGT